MIKSLETEEDVKRALITKLGHEPRSEIWDELTEDSYVGEAIQDGNIHTLLGRYKQQDKRYLAGKKGPSKIYTEPPDERLKFLSKIVAWDAAQERSVINFRQEALGGELLPPTQVDLWIKDVATKEKGSGIFYIKVRLPQGVHPQLGRKGYHLRPPLVIEGDMIAGEEREVLSYGAYRMKEWVPGAIPVPGGGILERLLWLSKYLTSTYSWNEAEATTFILTGLTPPLLLASATPKWSRHAPNTVTMELSLHLSPSKVAAFYGRVKGKLLSFYYPGRKRDRPMTTKHLNLAVFHHTHQGMKGAKMMSAWNKEHPQYRYDTVTNFLRDAKHAHDRLVSL